MVKALIDELEAIYAQSVANLRQALTAYVRDGTKPDLSQRAAGAFVYPEITVIHRPTSSEARVARAFARLNKSGTYTTTITHPLMFRDYLTDQLSLLQNDYGVEIHISRSKQEIPYPYVLDGAEIFAFNQAEPSELARWFPTTQLSHIGDEVADGLWINAQDGVYPLSLFDAARTDFSLARLKHYTGTPPANLQRYILFTNYMRYIDEFVDLACQELKKANSPYTALSAPSGVVVTAETADPTQALAGSNWRKHQMPAYHLMAPGGAGVSMVNIGVGPSNAKTICDHLAVLRPEAWIMIGHCGGLRPSQTIGDYVLAHAYLRDDHVLDDILPVEVPIPPLAEVQLALHKAAELVTGETGESLKRRLRTGTVVTTDDRNWELRYTATALRFNQSRAVAIDMESATVAAQGYRFRVPYGTLLCVSDKPLHGELKLPGKANRFYDQAISQHLRIGLAAIDELRREGPGLHSRKLRAFDEPPFR
ncbi:MAG: AMP nucleosidase [Alphaproteobacteria bacterium]|nr:AMP nucleosidase [Alphaproteobacteria bacterium]PHX98518.1 MAG: AMP nucleosidase [Rhodospirillaceae bacterium]